MGKICSKCGAIMQETDKFCAKCGNRSEVSENNEPIKSENIVQGGSKKLNGVAITSFICSILGIFYMGIIMGVCAVLFGISGFRRKKYFPEEYGEGFALAGLFVGIADIILVIYYLCIAHKYNFF